MRDMITVKRIDVSQLAPACRSDAFGAAFDEHPVAAFKEAGE